MQPAQSKLHFASADYALQAIHPLREGDADKPLEITLAPTRLVRAAWSRCEDTPRGT